MTLWAVILAAGESRRFNGIKALADWNGATLLSRAVKTAQDICGDNILIVTGAHRAEVAAAARVETVYNEDWTSGMGSSIGAGFKKIINYSASHAIILPVDQPFVTASHLRKLVNVADAEGRCALSRDGDHFGPPAAIPERFFRLFAKLQGDQGARSVLKDFAAVEQIGILDDIDTQDDLRRFKINLKKV